jgi:integrase
MRKLPSLCLHGTGQYYIRIQRRPIYLGTDQVAAEKERLRILAEWQATGRIPARKKTEPTWPTVDEFLAAYDNHARQYYRLPDGAQTSEYGLICAALAPVQRSYGHLRSSEVDSSALVTIQSQLVDGSWLSDEEKDKRRKKGHRIGCCRKTVNRHVRRIVRAFKWGVPRKLVPLTVYQELETVEPLSRGRSEARETQDVPPAPEGSIEPVRTRVSAHVRAMIDFQLWSGARPGEVCRLRPELIDKTGVVVSRLLREPVKLGNVWVYVARSKTAHHGEAADDRDYLRLVPIGPRAQEILRPFLEGREQTAHVFSPAEARTARYAAMRAARQTKVQPSQVDRKKKRPKKAPGKHYTVSSYGHAIAAAVRKAKEAGEAVEHWHPHQLRHNAATRLEREFGRDGWEIARIVLGHKHVSTTRIYVAEDYKKAFHAMERAG